MGENVNNVLNKYGEQVCEGMRQILQSNRKVATGQLINSIGYKFSDKEMVIYMKSHGLFVQKGRIAGSTPPPIAPIIAWLKVKKIPIGNGKMVSMVKRTTKGGLSNYSNLKAGYTSTRARKTWKTDAQIRWMATNIAKAIGRRGVAPVDFFKPLDNFLSESFKRDLGDAILKDIKIKYLK